MKKIIWGYASQFLQYGSAFLVLPFLLRNLSQPEMGVWYLFMSISILVSMLEMGFSQSLARSYVYVLGGATKLLKSGLSNDSCSQDLNVNLLASLHFACKKIYLVISQVGLIVLIFPGTYYIWYVGHEDIPIIRLFISWGVFCIAMFIGLYSKSYIPLMQGSDKFEDYYKSNALSNIIFIFLIPILLVLEIGLLGIAISFLASSISRMILSYYYTNSYGIHGHIKNIVANKKDMAEILSTLWPNAWRQGLVVVGAFLIIRANTLIASIYLGLDDTAMYSLSLQMFSVIQSISLTIFNLKQSQLSALIMSRDYMAIRGLIKKSVSAAIIIFLIGFAGAVFIAPHLLEAIKSNTRLLSSNMLLAMGIMVLLEMLHSIAASVIASSNQVPFVRSALLSGIAVCFGTIFCLSYFGLSIWWLIVTQACVQLAYNNWRWPLLVYRRYII